MALLFRLFVIAIGFLFASIAGGLVVVGMLLFPELSQIADGPIDPDALNIMMGFGFIFVSGFALLPALVVVLITEAFSIRSALAYAIGGALVGVACYLGLVPFDPATLHFDGIIRRHLEIMTGAGIVGGMVYWLIAGRNAGAWRDPPRPRAPLPPSQPAPPPVNRAP
ncbi:hypothetical protein FLL57_21660 [Rhodopseudomonas palustris]|uniref:Uncharacterized protein n=1 Tax=Rhodopseudomonas palustris (strain DX-1) TaxID=652103 RepID=E6VHA4_RHOPX|nr:hypothetical protein [Rhodopseudomonas palustris]QDL99754.1 hypothetical protein FLL57_21660 [Rhodopseudomonas palustris]